MNQREPTDPRQTTSTTLWGWSGDVPAANGFASSVYVQVYESQMNQREQTDPRQTTASTTLLTVAALAGERRRIFQLLH